MLIEGIVGVQKQAVLAAKRSLVTVEEIVDELRPGANSVVLPHWTITAIASAPGGARPSYAHGYYSRDNSFYLGWDEISRDRRRCTTQNDWASDSRALTECWCES